MISIDLSTQGFTNGQELDNTPITVNHDITLTFHKGTSSNSPKYYNTGTAVRCYGGNNFTVETSSGYISADTLKESFAATIQALEDISTYKQEALPRIKQTVEEFQAIAEEGQKYIDRLEERDQKLALPEEGASE